jgi:hypothetical protein
MSWVAKDQQVEADPSHGALEEVLPQFEVLVGFGGKFASAVFAIVEGTELSS